MYLSSLKIVYLTLFFFCLSTQKVPLNIYIDLNLFKTIHLFQSFHSWFNKLKNIEEDDGTLLQNYFLNHYFWLVQIIF